MTTHFVITPGDIFAVALLVGTVTLIGVCSLHDYLQDKLANWKRERKNAKAHNDSRN